MLVHSSEDHHDSARDFPHAVQALGGGSLGVEAASAVSYRALRCNLAPLLCSEEMLLPTTRQPEASLTSLHC